MPYKPTGRPPGRPKGVKAKAPVKRGPIRNTERELVENIDARVVQALDAIRPPELEPFKGGAVEYLMSIYKDPTVDRLTRMDAAKAAAKYETPALQAVTVTNSDPILEIEDLDELRRALGVETARLEIVPPPRPGGKGAPGGKPGAVRH